MAKVAFSKLDAKINGEVILVTYINPKNEEIQYEIKKYLPIEKKLEMISKIINQSIDENGYYNPMKLQIFTVLEVVFAYTNLNFTDKQKENCFKLYDVLISSGIFDSIIKVLSESEWNMIKEGTLKTIDNIYKYRNSAMGLLDTISQDYNELNMDLTGIQEKLSDPNALSLIKEILPLTNATMV